VPRLVLATSPIFEVIRTPTVEDRRWIDVKPPKWQLSIRVGRKRGIYNSDPSAVIARNHQNAGGNLVSTRVSFYALELSCGSIIHGINSVSGLAGSGYTTSDDESPERGGNHGAPLKRKEHCFRGIITMRH